MFDIDFREREREREREGGKTRGPANRNHTGCRCGLDDGRSWEEELPRPREREREEVPWTFYIEETHRHKNPGVEFWKKKFAKTDAFLSVRENDLGT